MGIKWKEDYSAKTQRIFGLVIGLGVGSIFGLVLAKGWPDGNWLLDWTAIAAIATFAASCSALYLSQKEGRRRTLLDRSVATIELGSAIVILNKYASDLSSICLIRDLEGSGPHDVNSEHDIHQNNVLHQHQSLLIGIKGIASEIQLEKLIVLPDGFAGRVAALSTESVLLKSFLEGVHIWLRTGLYKGDIRNYKGVVDYWSSLEGLHLEIADLLSIAREFFYAETGKDPF